MDQTASTSNGGATAIVTWTPPTATDNSGTQTLTTNYNSGAEFNIGTTTVNYESTDPSGNTAVCSFDVTVTGKCNEKTCGFIQIQGCLVFFSFQPLVIKFSFTRIFNSFAPIIEKMVFNSSQ